MEKWGGREGGGMKRGNCEERGMPEKKLPSPPSKKKKKKGRKRDPVRKMKSCPVSS